jgi:hypothetical protein
MENPKLKTFQFYTVRVVEDNHPVPNQPPRVQGKYRDPKEIDAGISLAKVKGDAEIPVDPGYVNRKCTHGAKQLARTAIGGLA